MRQVPHFNSTIIILVERFLLVEARYVILFQSILFLLGYRFSPTTHMRIQKPARYLANQVQHLSGAGLGV
jgi:hypothetical protein